MGSKTIRHKGKCENCGFRSHSLRKLQEHSRAYGHEKFTLPRNSNVKTGK